MCALCEIILIMTSVFFFPDDLVTQHRVSCFSACQCVDKMSGKKKAASSGLKWELESGAVVSTRSTRSWVFTPQCVCVCVSVQLVHFSSEI